MIDSVAVGVYNAFRIPKIWPRAGGAMNHAFLRSTEYYTHCILHEFLYSVQLSRLWSIPTANRKVLSEY